MKTGCATFGNMEEFPPILAKKLADRSVSNSLRTLGREGGLVDFSSNDYLGLASNEGIYSWAGQLVTQRGRPLNGATGSRLLSGNHPLYEEFETMLAQVHGCPTLVFNSGYDANLGFFASVPQRNDTVYYDEEIHASIRDGIRLGLARSHKFRHNDLQQLIDLAHRNSTGGEVYVVTESVFSMGGDTPDLNALVTLCREKGYRLVVDEAHALGVLGTGSRGLMQELGLQNNCFARILTFGKAIGAHGAAIAASREVISYLLNFARSLVYTTALPPHSVATLLAAHHYLSTGSGLERQQELRKRIVLFRQQLMERRLESCFIPSRSAIQACILPGNSKVKQASEFLKHKGFDVRPILSPTVSAGRERLRFCLHAFNSREEIQSVLESLQTIITNK